jgi:hypothetical protein
MGRGGGTFLHQRRTFLAARRHLFAYEFFPEKAFKAPRVGAITFNPTPVKAGSDSMIGIEPSLNLSNGVVGS